VNSPQAQRQQQQNDAIAGYRIVALCCFYGLILFFAVSTYQALSSISISSLIIWLIQVIPLVLFAPGLHLNIQRSNIWLSFIVLLYFTHGVLVAFDTERTVMGLIEIALCTGLFCSLVLQVKKLQNLSRQ